MTIVIRYIDNNRHIIERFLGIQHVSDTTASSLKEASSLGLFSYQDCVVKDMMELVTCEVNSMA